MQIFYICLFRLIFKEFLLSLESRKLEYPELAYMVVGDLFMEVVCPILFEFLLLFLK